MAKSEEAAEGPPAVTIRRPVLSWADNPLVRAVGRVPTTVHRKLLVAFVGTVVLLVVLGVLGLQVLSASNNRVALLGRLQQRAAAYQQIQNDAAQLRLLVALRPASGDINAYLGNKPSAAPSTGNLAFSDNAIRSTLQGLVADATNITFTPPPDERSMLSEIKRAQGQVSAVMNRIVALDQAGRLREGLRLQATEAEPRVNNLESLTGRLVSTAGLNTANLIDQNRISFQNSQRLFIAVAAASVVLALLLGFVLSWALIGPIRRVSTRLAAIASGDFSGHVDVPNRDELGTLAANVNQMNDELERLYQELETVSRHKSEFLANMSHELRTPMNAIIGFSDVLHEQMFGELNEQQLGYVEDVREAGQHLLALINDILDLSKVEAGRMELELGDVSLSQALDSGLTMHGERASRSGITLGLDVDPDIGVIQADERKLRQVIFNLLSNAVKFTPPGGRIDVTASLNDGMVEVAVADTGAGIAPEDQERIFEEFQQARGASSRPEGTGLGLTLSRRFIELHGGHLWVESEVGAGSTFRFTLPRSQPGMTQ